MESLLFYLFHNEVYSFTIALFAVPAAVHDPEVRPGGAGEEVGRGAVGGAVVG